MKLNNSFSKYATLNDDDFKILFRKFDNETFIFQFDSEGNLISNILLSNDVINKIQSAPTITSGDGETMQTL